MSARTISTDRAPRAIGPYSQGIVANGLLFTAGQIAIDPVTGQVVSGGVAAQTERALANVGAIIESVGAKWSDVVKTTVFLQDMNDFPVVNEVYARAFGAHRPARTTVEVSGLPGEGLRVEIDAIAIVPRR